MGIYKSIIYYYSLSTSANTCIRGITSAAALSLIADSYIKSRIIMTKVHAATGCHIYNSIYIEVTIIACTINQKVSVPLLYYDGTIHNILYI